MRGSRLLFDLALALGLVAATAVNAPALDLVDTVLSWFGGTRIERDGSQTIIKNGDEMYVGRESREIVSNLRVYGRQEPPSIPFGPKGPLGMVTHLLVTSPMEFNERLYRELGCEAQAAQNATLVLVLADVSDLREKIADLDPDHQRTCATVTGAVFTLQVYYRDGQVQPMDWEVQGGNDVDPNKVLIVSDLEEIDCE